MTTKRSVIHYLLLASSFLGSNVVCGQQGHPAPCQEVTQIDLATDSVKRKILFDYIGQCVRASEFTNDKGILHPPHHQNQMDQWVLPFINRKRSQGMRRVGTGGGFAILVEFLPDNTYTISRFG